ncbi:hypothetical protein [Janibacter alittae]|uniref:Integral membrane protein n=1 Tax=Janibacter alittae TaxID=3115209 RepID=A0ABZ2ML60_9MICO
MAAPVETHPRTRHLPAVGLVVALALMGLAMAVPAVLDWNVRVNSFPPIHAEWQPRVGWTTPVALVLAGWAGFSAHRMAQVLPWRRLLIGSFLAGLAWMLSLALIDGWSGVGHILTTDYEYLQTAREVTDLTDFFDGWVGRIRYGPDNLPVHVAGHPAGALLFFVLLVRVGLGSGLAAGLVVTALAATTAVAVLVTLRALGAEEPARRAAPFLVLGPAAIWQSVSADAMFAAVAAWGVAALAVAATRRSRTWSVVAGLLLGYCVMLSYGLVLLGVVAIATMLIARSFFPMAIAVVAACVVVLAFALAGFAWWEAYPALHDRYYAGVGGRRPPSYWMWGNLAALLFCAGPMLGSGVAQLLGGWHQHLAGARSRVVALLAGSGLVMIALADVSQMSRAEVERIWLPFVPWLMLSCALLPSRWRRIGLVIQLVAALLVAHLLKPDW